jgi:hypothetical protein
VGPTFLFQEVGAMDRTSPIVEALVTWLVFSLGAAIVFFAIIPSF